MGFNASSTKQPDWTDEEVLRLADLLAGRPTSFKLFEELAPKFGRTAKALEAANTRFGISNPQAKPRPCNLCGKIFFSAGNRRCGRFHCKDAGRRAA